MTARPDPDPARRVASAARRTIHALADGRDVFEDFFDQVEVGLAMADLSTRYLRVNQTYADLLGRPPEELIGVAFPDVVRTDDGPALQDRLQRLVDGHDEVLAAEERYIALSGRELWVLHTVRLVYDAAEQPAWFAVSAQDVTERRRAEEDLRDLTASLAERAVRDPLTGLANRVLLEERLRAALSRDARTGGATSLLYLDLDGFKPVNDRHGHAVGDEVLKEIAGRLSAAVRPSDTVARPGGDEFVVLAEGTDESTVVPLVARLRDSVAAPLRATNASVGSGGSAADRSGGQGLTVGVSIGVAVSHRGDADPSSLLAEADRAMYAAKRAAKHAAGQPAGQAGRPPSTRAS